METGTFSLILEKMTLPFQHSLSHEVSICNIKNSKQRRQLKEPSLEGQQVKLMCLITWVQLIQVICFLHQPKRMQRLWKKNSPAMIFLPSQSTREVLNEMIDATNNGVALTGAAATGSMGPLIGKVEIGELKDSYYFRVSLPGVSMDKREFNCVIRADGKVTIQGILTTGEQIVSNESGVFRMLTQNLGPPGPFTVSFQLPGPVNNQEVKSHLACGFLEAIVKKM